MENYVVTVQEEELPQHVETMFKLSFRCHCNDDEQEMIWYINNFNHWISSHELSLISYTMGIHRETGKIHFHYHTVLMGKEFKSSYQTHPITLFMRDYKLGKIKTLHNLGVSPYKECYQQKYGTKSNLSLKISSMKDDKDTCTYLQYPLKEGSTINSLNKVDIIPEDVDQLTRQAIAEFRVAKRKADKFKQKKIDNENSWTGLVTYLDQQGCNEGTTQWVHVYENVMRFYKETNKKPPTFRKMENDADAYSFFREIAGFDPRGIARRAQERRSGC